jgi:hypothetical protein
MTGMICRLRWIEDNGGNQGSYRAIRGQGHDYDG